MPSGDENREIQKVSATFLDTFFHAWYNPYVRNHRKSLWANQTKNRILFRRPTENHRWSTTGDPEHRNTFADRLGALNQAMG